MLDCKEVAEILSSEKKSSRWEKVMLSVHLGMCKCCKGYSKHLESMRDGYRKLFSQNAKSLDFSFRLKRSKARAVEKIREILSSTH